MSEKLDKVKERILDKKIKVVSFDIFDTLLVRPVCSPTDLFKIVGMRSKFGKRRFQTMRIYAEAQARREKPFNADDITLDDIYAQLIKKFGVTEDEAERLKNTELDVEGQYLYRRESVGKLFEEAKHAGKEVIIVSDMYLPKPFLEKVLKKNGYEGYRRLYLSCEYKAAKGTGKLYQCVIGDYKKQGVQASQIIHIGDNTRADIRQAENHGMQAAHIPSAISVYKSKKQFAALLNAMHPETDHAFLTGYLANCLFDDGFYPFSSDSVISGNAENLGYILAPLFFAFTKWLLQETDENHIDTMVFAYRDGYLIEKLMQAFQKYRSVPILKRAYLSRKVRMDYMLSEPGGFLNNIIDFPPNASMTVEKFIQTRMAVTDEEHVKKVLDIFLEHGYTSRHNKLGAMDRYIHFLHQLEPFTKNHSAKDDIDRYCKEVFAGSKNPAVFDVGYRGSVSRFVQDKLQIQTAGYHLLASSLIHTNHAGAYHLKSYIYYGMETPKESMILHALIEDILCAPEGSVYGISYQEEELKLLRESYQEQECLTEIQKKIIHYTEGFLQLFHQDLRDLEFDHYLEFELLMRLLTAPCKADAAAIGRLAFYDAEFIARSGNMYQEWNHKHYPTVSGTLKAVKTVSRREAVIKALDKVHLLPAAVHAYHAARKLCNRSKALGIRYGCGWEGITRELEHLICDMKTQEMLMNKRNILVAGDMVSFDKGVCRYLNMLSERLHQKGYNLVLLSEAVLAPDELLKKRISFAACKVPDVLGKNYYKKNCKVDTPDDITELITRTDYLSWAVENWTMRHSDMDQSYAQMLAGIAHIYYNQVFDYLRPCGMVLWNEFHALHHIIKGIACDRGIPVFYMEFGSIPGTFAFESSGQMGESYPAVKYKEFAGQPVSEEELQRAGEIWEYLKQSKLNRNVQNSSEHEKKVLHALDTDKPIVFLAGQNDFESGLCPYREHTKKYHSPVFKSSYEALLYFAELAEKNNWTLLYKPHPIVYALGSQTEKIPRHVIVLNEMDIHELIDAADVTVTILSQVGYVSTIREKATVMLGYTQLRGKSCTYEAFQKDGIEETLKRAIKDRFQNGQQQAFLKHLAQMVKYYLYDDLSDRKLRYGQPLERMVEQIMEKMTEEAQR